jgi:hypothetical protein
MVHRFHVHLYKHIMGKGACSIGRIGCRRQEESTRSR